MDEAMAKFRKRKDSIIEYKDEDELNFKDLKQKIKNEIKV
jgi:hypothetical protein